MILMIYLNLEIQFLFGVGSGYTLNARLIFIVATVECVRVHVIPFESLALLGIVSIFS